jgi:hypothetical protein
MARLGVHTTGIRGWRSQGCERVIGIPLFLQNQLASFPMRPARRAAICLILQKPAAADRPMCCWATNAILLS